MASTLDKIKNKDNYTMINEIVYMTVNILKNKHSYNELLIEAFKESGKESDVRYLQNLNVRIEQAIEVLIDNGGSWA
jgi:uncharacterized protein YxeA